MGEPAWDKMAPKDLGKLREQALQRQVRYQLYAYSPFYRKLLDDAGVNADEFQDLATMPLVDRNMLSEKPLDFYLRPTRQQIQRWGAGRQVAEVLVEMVIKGSDRSERLVRDEYEKAHTLQTLGTHGGPLSIHLSRYDLVTLSTQGKRMLQVAGVQQADVLLNLLEPSGCFWAAWLGGVALGLRQSAPGRLEPPQAAQMASQTQASVIVAKAQDVMEILDSPASMFSSLRTIILAPEPDGPGLRSRIESKAPLALKVLATYYFAEGRTWWSECAEGGAAGGYHTNPDLEIFELISSETSSSVPIGARGEIVFTGLDQRGTAVARYRPGDLAESLALGTCGYCGRAVDRVIGPISRVGRPVELRLRGREDAILDPVVLKKALANTAVAGWEVEVTTSPGNGRSGLIEDECYVMFKPVQGKDPARLAVELDGVFRSNFGFTPTQFVWSDRTQGRIVDLRQK